MMPRLPQSPNKLAPIPGQRLIDEQTLAMIVALASETIVLRARLDTCERLLIDAGLIAPDAIETYSPDATAQGQREGLRLASMRKIFRALHESAEAELANIPDAHGAVA